MFHRFLLFSGFAAAVNLLAGQLFYGVLGFAEGWQYAFSVGIAFLCGMVVSYRLNKRYTFPPSYRDAHREITDFFLVSIGGLILTSSMAYGLRSQMPGMLGDMTALVPLPISIETLAHVISVGVTAIYSFLAHKFISFRPAWQSSAPPHEQKET